MPTIISKAKPDQTSSVSGLAKSSNEIDKLNAIQLPPVMTMMPTQYRHPLITDAIINMQVSLASEDHMDGLVRLADALRDDYPRQEPILSQTLSAHFSLSEGDVPSSEIKMEKNGIRLFTEDGLNIVFLALDNFTFIRLKPYDGWETFSTEARRVWNMYKSSCRIESINRVAIRYVDRLDLLASDSVHDYLLLQPYVPAGFPSNAVQSFFMQLQMPQEDLDSNLVINLARIADPAPEKRSFVMDFDLFCQSQWDTAHDDAVWELLKRLRVRKNELFEASITDKTRVLMEPIG